MQRYEDCLLDELVGERMATANVVLSFTTDYAGGQPADEKAVRAFAEHHLGLAGQELEDATKRILREEVGEKDTTGTDAKGNPNEVDERESYGLCVVRRNGCGWCWVGTWQVRAMLKQAASRLGLFAAKGKVGSKGDLSEAMLIRAAGPSDMQQCDAIGVVVDRRPYSGRKYQKFMGSVQTPQGRKSIVCDHEMLPIGAELHFTVQWPSGRIKADDMARIFALSRRIGLGSVKAMERGRFAVKLLEINEA